LAPPLFPPLFFPYLQPALFSDPYAGGGATELVPFFFLFFSRRSGAKEGRRCLLFFSSNASKRPGLLSFFLGRQMAQSVTFRFPFFFHPRKLDGGFSFNSPFLPLFSPFIDTNLRMSLKLLYLFSPDASISPPPASEGLGDETEQLLALSFFFFFSI